MSEYRTPGDQRIAKLLARAGVASRREVERMIAEGRVAIGGRVVTTPATSLPSLKGVTVDGAPVAAAEPTRLFLFHKPPGVLTTAFDPKGRQTIYDRLPADLPRVMPVGRLDLNTEGLLLLTTDGEFKRQLELPATGVERSYRARAYGQVTQADLESLIEGVEIEGVRYGPIDANLERRTGANVWIELTLREGKNREVRRVLEHLGLEVSRLIRTRYGPFVLADLPAGAVGEVRGRDLDHFRRTLKIPADARRAEEGRIAVDAAVRAPRAARPAVAHPVAAPPTDAPTPARTRRAPAPRKAEVREALDTRPPRRGEDRPARPANARPTNARPSTDRPSTDRPSSPDRSQRAARPSSEARPARDARPQGDASRPRNARPLSPVRDPEAVADAPRVRPAKPKKGAGWAKAKPRPRPPGKPRRGPGKRP